MKQDELLRASPAVRHYNIKLQSDALVWVCAPYGPVPLSEISSHAKVNIECLQSDANWGMKPDRLSKRNHNSCWL